MGEIKLEERNITGDFEKGPGGTLEMVLFIECPGCGGKTRHPLRTVKTGATVAICPNECGHATVFSGEDIEKAQRGMDELVETFKSMGIDWRIT